MSGALRSKIFDTRRVLLGGLGGLLLLMILTGGYSLGMLHDLRDANAAIRERFLAHSRLLENIRTGIFLSGTYARDYLLAPEQHGEEQRAQMETAQQATERAVNEYAAGLDAGELAPFSDLRSEIHAYYRLLALILERGTAATRRSGFAYFSAEVVRRRTAMLQITDRISALNERDLVRGDRRAEEVFGRYRLSLAVAFALALCLAVLLAWLTLRRIVGLDRESTRARTELRELSARLVDAQEQERKAIARELHDEVGQTLSALLVETGNTAAMLTPESEVLRPHLVGIRSLAEDCVRVVRNMALLLRPSMLDDLGLVPALEWQARETARRTGMRIRVHADTGADQLSENLKTCIYRLVQEALNNVVKHAAAGQVEIEVRTTDAAVRVSVVDDGRGFDAARVRGLGRAGMEERVAQLGGWMRVESAPGSGAAVRVELPRGTA